MKKYVLCAVFAVVASIFIFRIALSSSNVGDEGIFLTCDYDKLISSATSNIFDSVKTGKSKSMEQLNEEIRDAAAMIRAEIIAIAMGKPVVFSGAPMPSGMKHGGDITFDVAMRCGIVLTDKIKWKLANSIPPMQ